MDRFSFLLKIDFPYFFRGGFWLSFGLGLSTAISLLVSVVFANSLSAEVYGQYRYVSSVIGIVSVLTLTGLGTALSRAVAQKKEGSLSVAFRTLLLWSLPVSLVGLSLVIYALKQGNFNYALVFFLFSMTFPLLNSASLYFDFLHGRGDFVRSTKYYLISSLVTNSFLGLAALFASSQFFLLFPVVFLIQMIFSVVIYKRIKSEVPMAAKGDAGLITYSKHLSVTNILASISDQIDSTVLFLVAGPQILAVYAFAVAGPEFIKSLFKQIVPISLPKLAAMKWREVWETVPRHSFKVFLLAMLATFAYAFSAPYFFKIIFPKYTSAIIYSQVFSLSMITFSSHLLVSALQAQKRVRDLYIFNIVPPSLNIFLIIILTFYFGLWGLIAARIISRLVAFCILYRPFLRFGRPNIS